MLALWLQLLSSDLWTCTTLDGLAPSWNCRVETLPEPCLHSTWVDFLFRLRMLLLFSKELCPMCWCFFKSEIWHETILFLAVQTSSNGSKSDHDEIDIEILGNTTDKTYTLQTNIFVDGFGNREMRHDLTWFEPCQDYHEYFIQWNSAFTV